MGIMMRTKEKANTLTRGKFPLSLYLSYSYTAKSISFNAQAFICLYSMFVIAFSYLIHTVCVYSTNTNTNTNTLECAIFSHNVTIPHNECVVSTDDAININNSQMVTFDVLYATYESRLVKKKINGRRKKCGRNVERDRKGTMNSIQF